jgi:hypothetical protein
LQKDDLTLVKAEAKSAEPRPVVNDAPSIARFRCKSSCRIARCKFEKRSIKTSYIHYSASRYVREDEKPRTALEDLAPRPDESECVERPIGRFENKIA